MNENQTWPAIAGFTLLLLVVALIILGPSETPVQKNPGADPSLQFNSETAKPLSSKFKPLVEKTDLFQAEPDKERLDLDTRLDDDGSLPAYRKEFKTPKDVLAGSDNFRGTPFLSYFGGPGKQPGQFAYPRAMASTEAGSLFIVDKSGRIQRFGEDSRLELVVRTPNIDRGKPTGLGLTRDNHLLVADTHYARVLTYDLDLNLVTEFGSAGPEPGKFMFVTDCEECWNGEIFVTDYGDVVARVQVFSRTGKFLRHFGTFGSEPGQFQRPMAIAFDSAAKEVYIADAVNHRIQVFDINGKYHRSLGGFGTALGQLKYPYDVVLDGQSGAWIAEFGNNRIQILNRKTGASMGVIGKAGRRLGSIAYPWSMSLLPNDRVAILDSGNDRVYIARRSSILETGS